MEISDKFWADITQAERAAAITLGYDEDTWNYHGVEMPNVGLDDVRLYASAHAAIALQHPRCVPCVQRSQVHRRPTGRVDDVSELPCLACVTCT